MTNPVDIKAKAPFPAGALSNFAPHRFELDGVICGSMEGFVQGLKVEDPREQERLCALSGGEAQGRGRQYDWKTSGTLWWRGEPIDRLSDAYQTLLDRAYDALYEQNKKFRDALAATGDAKIVHTLGTEDPTETILTPTEFCARLHRLRGR
jgi:predicted NAD-dependent protein-ADP-ribosyltransferase YbiA (DUF1768 family)